MTPESGEGVGKEIIGPAVYVFRRDNVIALMGQILEGIGNRCGTGGHGQSCASAFQCGHSFSKTSSVGFVSLPYILPPAESANLAAASSQSWNTYEDVW